MSNLSKYMTQLRNAFPDAAESDVYSIGKQTFDKVGEFLVNHNAVKVGAYEHMYSANEALSFDDAVNSTGIEELQTLVRSCGISDYYVRPACEAVLNIMDRCLHSNATIAWSKQNAKTDNVANNTTSTPLSDIYASDTVSMLLSNAAPSSEAFGVNIDLAVPDLKVGVTVAIMNFHSRLLPRIVPTKSTSQPNVQYMKEYLEVYDLSKVDGDRQRLVDLYADPKLASNTLKRIEPLAANDTEGAFLVADGRLKFGVKANLMKLAYGANEEGKAMKYNRTDLVAEGVKMDCVYVDLKTTAVTTAETFKILVPESVARLTRMVNADDSALRNADIKFRALLRAGDKPITGAASQITSHLVDIGTGVANSSIIVDVTIKPTISLKYSDVDCLGAVSVRIGMDVTGSTPVVIPGLAAALNSYSIDARYSEENLRKTSVAVWTHRQPFHYDIPIGRNYVFDYAIGQTNAEENATNLTKVIGIGQDHVALHDILIRTLDDVYDRLKQYSDNPDDQLEYVGKRYVAGDKVRPSIFIGKLDYSELETIRDADRSGDIKQKAITYLTAVTTKLLADSFLLQQLGGSGVTFRCVTSPGVIGNVIGMPHIHDHMNKEDARDIGDGVEYVLVLPNGVRMEFVISTFDYMINRIVGWPIIKNNTESELNYATNWDYGTMVAQYTPSGEAAHHRLFANIRELPIVTDPIGFEIDIDGMDIVDGIAANGKLTSPVIRNVAISKIDEIGKITDVVKTKEQA